MDSLPKHHGPRRRSGGDSQLRRRTDHGFGLVFHFSDGSNYCEFIISADGHYRCGKIAASRWLDLVPWTPLRHPIQPGERITLKVLCKGSQIALHVNGQHLGTVTDDDPGHGYVGLIAYKDIHARFHDFRVWS